MAWPHRQWPRSPFPITTHEFDMRPVVRKAIVLSGCKGDSIFDLRTFGMAVQAEFDLRATPDAPWCAAVLCKLTYVRPISGGLHWQYLGPR